MSELERCRPWIEKALERSGNLNSWEDVEKGVASGMMQLWPAPKGCVVTELVIYPRGRALRVFLAGGELGQILAMTKDMARWAKAQGCDFAEFDGRFGWQRVLKQIGWKPRSIVMELDLGSF